MSRKRTFSQTTRINPMQPRVGVCRCRYYSPGLYPTFQVTRESSPYTNEASLYEFPLQWELDDKATYVVDSRGIVYYLSDLENNFQLSNNRMLDADANISYHYECDESEPNYMEQDDEEEPDVSPFKRERYNTDSDDSDTEEEDDTITQSVHSERVDVE